MRWITRGFIAVCLSYLALVVFCNRALFFSSFDASYWKDKFEHSQWALPLSVRTIGDDGLYLYEGYRLIHGDDPTRYNAEVPPLGKYLIGASILTTGNGYIYGFITTSLVVVMFFLLCQLLIQNRLLSLAATTLFITDPLITSQFPRTMLDSLQAFFLLMFILLLLTARKRKRWLPAIAGLVLGGFSGIKFPILTPILILIGFITIWKTYRNIRLAILYCISIPVGYLIPYIPYFIGGHTLVDWIRTQKWIISFYTHSNLVPTWGSAFINLLTGFYQNIYDRSWVHSPEWSPAWTVISVAALMGLYRIARGKQRSFQWIIIACIAGYTLLLYQVIPFWTRYLVLLLPLLYLLAVYSLSHIPRRWALVMIGVLICVNITASVPILFPTPEATAHQIMYNWEHMFFQDMYQDITTGSKSRWSSAAFNRFALMAFNDAEIESIDIRLQPMTWHRFVSPQTMRVVVTYSTRNLGQFSETHNIPILKEDGRWRIPWDWSFLFTGFGVGRQLKTTIDPARRGSLLASDKKPIAEDVAGDMIWITPQRITVSRETELLTYISGLFQHTINVVHLHQRIHGNALTDQPVPIGVPPTPMNTVQKQLLTSFSGVTLTPAYGRVNYGSGVVDVGAVTNTHYFECCSRLYSTTTYDGTSGAERAKNTILKGINGGSLVITDDKGRVQRTLILLEKQDGRNTQP